MRKSNLTKKCLGFIGVATIIVGCGDTTTRSDIASSDGNSSNSAIILSSDIKYFEDNTAESSREDDNSSSSFERINTESSSKKNESSGLSTSSGGMLSSNSKMPIEGDLSNDDVPSSDTDIQSSMDSSDASRSSSNGVLMTAIGSGDWESGASPATLMRNFEQWKITFPDGSEIKDLKDVKNEYYYVDGDAIVFYSPIKDDNNSTPNSPYIRSELRERTDDGKEDVYWTTDGTHVIYVKQAITHLPIVKDHLVATQIHGNKTEGIDDAMVLRLEGTHLFLSFNGGDLQEDLTIKNDYALGTIHEVIFKVVDGKHYVYYSEDGKLNKLYDDGVAESYLIKSDDTDYVMDLSYDETYFKVGNYTQSNSSKEGDSSGDPENYGEVKVWDFWVTHE